MARTAWSAKVLSSETCCSVKGLHLVTQDDQQADHVCVAQQRNAEHRAVLAGLLDLPCGVLGIREHVFDLHRTLLEQRAADHRAAVGHIFELGHQLEVGLGDRAVIGDHLVVVGAWFGPEDVAEVGSTQLDGATDDRLQDVVEIESRARHGADDLA